MVFSSVIFLFLFLPLILALHFALPQSWRNGFLLLASLLFYAWGETFYVLVMLLSTTGNWLFGLWVARQREQPRASKIPVAVSAVFNLGLLIAYKYANFLVDNLNVAFGWAGLPPFLLAPVHLPIGISFFTFQAMSYVIDVHRGHVAVQRRWDKLALYIAFFPQLIAGPIVRYADIAREIDDRRITLADFASGVRLFIIGLAKKVLIANIASAQADQIFALPGTELTAPLAWFAVFLYAYQIYFDFAGYSDMAIGLGRMFGFHFLINFNYPYIAKTLTEFWQRWHLSLSTWFRDYLFNPLGGYKCSRPRAYINLLIVFVLCGMWHGASWNFVAFGLLHSLFLILERVIRAKQLAFFKTPASHLYFLFIYFLSLVLFRSVDIAHAGYFFHAMCTGGCAPPGLHPLGRYWNPELVVALVGGAVAAMPFLPWLRARVDRAGLAASAAWAGHLALALLFILCAMKLASGTHNPFIYFRF